MGRDSLNLDLAPKRKRTCLIRDARWEIRHPGKRLSIDAVHGLVVRDIPERKVHRNEFVEAETS
jgi:hypothetical protein